MQAIIIWSPVAFLEGMIGNHRCLCMFSHWKTPLLSWICIQILDEEWLYKMRDNKVGEGSDHNRYYIFYCLWE